MWDDGVGVTRTVRAVDWFALAILEALECGRLVRSGEDPSTTSSNAHWERTDDDMGRLEAASAADSRAERVLERPYRFDLSDGPDPPGPSHFTGRR
jgi:hypothetical protein